MAKDDQFLNRVIEKTAGELTKRVEHIRNFTSVPIGRTKLNPAQFQAKYGMSVSEAKHLEKRYGPEAVQEILDVLGGQNAVTS